MDCATCRHANRDGARFCEACGRALGRACSACGMPLRGSARFCDGCGAALPEPARPRSDQRDPRSYTPRHLAAKILRSKSVLEGERKQVTVLFVDVERSTELSAELDPEEWHRILDGFFRILTEGVHRFEGTVNQYTGDGIMALFGAPIAHEDHAQRACYAALHLQDRLRDFGQALRRQRGLHFSTRLGLNSGEVVVGKIGDDLRMDYTAQGHTVALAERIQQLAEAGEPCVSDRTAALVRGYFRLEDLGECDLGGAGDGVRVYALKGAEDLRSRLDVARAQGFSRFVGRDRELAALEASLDRMLQGEGQVVGVVAEAGVGKSRLCFEFVERCRERSVPVVEGHCLPHGKDTPFLPALELFRAYFGIGERDAAEEARRKIAGTLELLDEGFQETLPLVFEFLGVPDPARPVPPMDPEARQRRLFAFLRRLVEARSEREPAVTFLDDIHWIDRGSDELLAELVEVAPRTRTLVLVNFRPAYHASWLRKSTYQQISLRPLGSQAIGELLVDLLGSDPSLAGLPELIRERAGGNPFFTEEVVRALVESGSLEGERGSYRLVTPVEKVAIPGTVHAVLAARIDRLPEREKQILQAAAVIGREFAEPILAEVGELPAPELGEGLGRLKDAEFVHQQALHPVAEYAFRHPLTQEVALQSQLQERRARVHAAVARAIEGAHPRKLDEQASLLAYHWEEAGEPLEAARWHQRAAAWLRSRNPVEGMRHMQQVLVLTRGLPPSEERGALRLTACRSLLAAEGWRVGLSADALEAVYEEGLQLADRGGDRDEAIRLHLGYAATAGFAGDLRRFRRVAREALGLVGESTSRGAAASLYLMVSYSSLCLGYVPEAMEWADRTRRVAEGDPEAGVETTGFSAWGWGLFGHAEYLAACGRLEEARSRIAQAIRIARTHNLREPLGWAFNASIEIADFSGHRAPSAAAEEAHRNASESVTIAEATGGVLHRVHAYRSLGLAHVLNERWSGAVEILETALHVAREQRTGLELEALMLAYLSRARRGAGDVSAARRDAEQAISRAGEQGARYFECHARLALVRALRAGRGAEVAEEIADVLERAAELVAETGAGALAPQVAEERARLAWLRGAGTSAEAELRRAHELFMAIAAHGHAERLARELAELER